jgi:HlyD family secretion protein
VEAKLDEMPAKGELLVGYSADLEVILEVRENALRVPTSALQEGSRVLLYLAEGDGGRGKLEERTIKTGITNWEYAEVLEGLKPGDRIVTSLEREGIKAGAVVTPETTPENKP